MVFKRMCKDLLEMKDLHCKAILEGKGLQCSKNSHEYTDIMLKEQEIFTKRFLEQKDENLQQMRNYTDHLINEKEFHLEHLQKTLEQQQDFFCIFAFILATIIVMLMMVVYCLFVGQEKEKQNLNLKYESIINEKSERIHQLEKQEEEQRKKEEKTATVTGQPMPHHPFMFVLPGGLSPTASTLPLVGQLESQTKWN